MLKWNPPNLLNGKLNGKLVLRKFRENLISSMSLLLLEGKIWAIKNMEKICTREW